MTNEKDKERDLPFLTEEAEAGLKKAVASPVGVAARIALGAYCVFGLILPSVANIGNKVQTQLSNNNTPAAQGTKETPRTTGRVSRGTCYNFTIDELAELTTFNPDQMAERNGQYVCAGSGQAARVDDGVLVVRSTDNVFNRVYCRPSQEGFIRTLPELRPNQEILSVAGTLRVEVGSIVNTIYLDDCGYLREPSH